VLFDHYVKEGTRDTKKKTNQAEGAKIAELICDTVEKTANRQLKPGDNATIDTIGIISFGGEAQWKLIKEAVDEMLEDFPPQVVDRHKIMYGTCAQWQGAERDIMFLSMTHDGKSVNRVQERSIIEGKRHNVALSRAKKRMDLIRSLNRCQFKHKNDWKCKIVRAFQDAQHATAPAVSEHQKRRHLMLPPLPPSPREKIEQFLSSPLEKHGFEVGRNKGNFWCNALCVVDPSCDRQALLCVAGDTTEGDVLDEQMSLEGAGRHCLRVDGLSLALRPTVELKEVFEFLEMAGLSKQLQGSIGNHASRPTDAASDATSPANTMNQKRKAAPATSSVSRQSTCKRSKVAAIGHSESACPSISSLLESSPSSSASKRTAEEGKSAPSSKKGRGEQHDSGKKPPFSHQSKVDLSGTTAAKAQKKAEKADKEEGKKHRDFKSIVEPFGNGTANIGSLDNEFTSKELQDVIEHHHGAKPKGLKKMKKDVLVAQVKQRIRETHSTTV